MTLSRTGKLRVPFMEIELGPFSGEGRYGTCAGKCRVFFALGVLAFWAKGHLIDDEDAQPGSTQYVADYDVHDEYHEHPSASCKPCRAILPSYLLNHWLCFRQCRTISLLCVPTERDLQLFIFFSVEILNLSY